MRRIVAMMTSTSPSAGSRTGIAVRPPTGVVDVRLPNPFGRGPFPTTTVGTVVDGGDGAVVAVGCSRTAGVPVVVVVGDTVVVVVLVVVVEESAAFGIDVVVVVVVVDVAGVVVDEPPGLELGTVVDVVDDGSVSGGAAPDGTVKAICTAQPANTAVSMPARTRRTADLDDDSVLTGAASVERT